MRTSLSQKHYHKRAFDVVVSMGGDAALRCA
jgi:hypothetical protein